MAWYSFVAGTTARASEVNANFSYVNGHIIPHNAGTYTDSSYDLGSSSYYWRATYTDSLYTTGNIGVGTTSTVVDVNSTTYFTIYNALGSEVSISGNQSSGGNILGYLQFANFNIGTSDKRSALIGGFTDLSGTDGKLLFYVANTTASFKLAMTIKSTGDIGVGVATPIVDENLTTYFTVYNSGTGATLNAGSTKTGSGDPLGYLQFANYNIGTADKRLAMIGGFTDDSSTHGKLSFYIANTTGNFIVPMTIKSSNLIGVATVNPSQTLDVNGNCSIANTLTTGQINCNGQLNVLTQQPYMFLTETSSYIGATITTQQTLIFNTSSYTTLTNLASSFFSFHFSIGAIEILTGGTYNLHAIIQILPPAETETSFCQYILNLADVSSGFYDAEKLSKKENVIQYYNTSYERLEELNCTTYLSAGAGIIVQMLANYPTTSVGKITAQLAAFQIRKIY